MEYLKSSNTYFATPNEEPKSLVQVEIGDSKQTDFYPQVKLMRWDNEVNFSVRLIHDEENPTYFKYGENINWEGEKVDACFYHKPDEDGYEFEVILKEKPKSNVVSMTMQTKGLEFCYQPSLKEEFQDGYSEEFGVNITVTDTDVFGEDGLNYVHRPENVVGSYIVNHGGSYQNFVGGKEYKDGSTFQIFRPKIVDADGNWVWGSLNVEKELLTITIPQDFLDKAVYPVVVDPTFGFSVSSTSIYGTANGSRFATIPTSGAGSVDLSGNVVSVTVYIGHGIGGDDNYVKPVLWNSDKTVVTNGVAPAVKITAGAQEWTSTYSSHPTVTAGTGYYLGWVWEIANQSGYYQASSDGGESANSFASPTSIGTISQGTRRYRAWATYNANVTVSASIQSSAFSQPTSVVSVVRNVAITVAILSAAFTQIDPSITAGGHTNISAGTQSAIFSTINPVITTSRSISISPTIQSSAFTNISPVVSVTEYDKYTKFGIYYDNADNDNEYVHAFLKDGDTLYETSIHKGKAYGTRSLVWAVDAAASNPTLALKTTPHARKWTLAVDTQIQGIAQDSTHIYLAEGSKNGVLLTPYISKLNKSDLSWVGTVSWDGLSLYTLQDMEIIKSSVDSGDYMINTLHAGGDSHCRFRTFTTNEASWGGNWYNRRLDNYFSATIETVSKTDGLCNAGSDIISVGTNRDSIGAAIVKIKQNTSTAGKLKDTVDIMTTLNRVGFSTDGQGLIWADAYIDGSYVWTVGNAPKNVDDVTDGVYTIMARFLLSDLSLQNFWEIESTKATGTNHSFRGSGILVESDRVYITNWHVPHTGVGDDAEVTLANTQVVTCMDKSELLAGTEANYVVWSRAYEECGVQGQHASYPNSIFADTNYLYVGGWSTAGPRTGWNAAVIKIDKAMETRSPSIKNNNLADIGANVNEYKFSNYLSFTTGNVAAIIANTDDNWGMDVDTDIAWGNSANQVAYNQTGDSANWADVTLTSDVYNINGGYNAVNIYIDVQLQQAEFYQPTSTVSANSNAVVSAELQSASFQTIQPSLTLNDNEVIAPSIQSATFSTLVPTITATRSVTNSVAIQSAAFNNLSPVVSGTRNVTNSVAIQSAAFAQLTSTTSAIRNVENTPAIQSANFSQLNSVVSITRNVSNAIAIQSALFETIQPSITNNDNETIAPAIQSATFSNLTPVVSITRNVSSVPAIQSAAFTNINPVITTSKDINVAATLQSATFAQLASTVAITRNVSTIPVIQSASFETLNPSVSTTQNGEISTSVNAGIQSVVFNQPVSVVSAQRQISSTAGIQISTFSNINPTISVTRNISNAVAIQESTFATLTPAISTDSYIHITVNATIQSATFATNAVVASITRNVSSSAAIQTATFTTLTPSVSTDSNVHVSIDAGIQSATFATNNVAVSTSTGIICSPTIQTATFLNINPTISTESIVPGVVNATLQSATFTLIQPEIQAVDSTITYYPNKLLFVDALGAVVQLGRIKYPVWATSGRPAATIGEYGFNKTLGKMEIWDGDNWIIIN